MLLTLLSLSRFLLPTSLIICNDIMAYVWGKAVGRTPLTELSAKKTWEGFMGAFISTVIFAFYVCVIPSSPVTCKNQLTGLSFSLEQVLLLPRELSVLYLPQDKPVGDTHVLSSRSALSALCLSSPPDTARDYGDGFFPPLSRVCVF